MIYLKESEKQILLTLICYRGFKSIQQARVMVDRGLAEFTGDQYNESWCWKYEELEKLTLEELNKLYNRND